MPTLLDTHAWLWWVTEDRRLSKRAGSAIATALGQQALWVSFISLWEIAKFAAATARFSVVRCCDTHAANEGGKTLDTRGLCSTEVRRLS